MTSRTKIETVRRCGEWVEDSPRTWICPDHNGEKLEVTADGYALTLVIDDRELVAIELPLEMVRALLEGLDA